jgi:hypothetical protein
MDHARLRFLLERSPDDAVPASAGIPLGAQVTADGIFEQVVRDHRGIGVSEVVTRVKARLAGPDTDRARAVRAAMNGHLLDPTAPVAMLAPDVLIHAHALYRGAVFTHRLTAGEQVDGELEIHTDLAALQRSHGARVEAGQLYVEDREKKAVVWIGPHGWLHHLPLDALLAVRVSPDLEVMITALDAEPPTPSGLVDLLRAVYDDELAQTGLLTGLVDRLIAAADQPPRVAVARWLAAVAAERDARVLDAEAHLRSAVRHGGGWAPAERRLADYRLDRERPAGTRRAAWLVDRAEAHLRRVHEFDTRTMAQLADLAGCDERIAVDVLLHEDGWFTRFLADRGPLLAPDDVRAAAACEAVERTVYEVARATPEGCTLRDMRTGAECAVAGGRAIGSRVCGRAVPDGAVSRFVGVVLDVPTAWPAQLRRVLDRRDGRGLLAWVAAANGPAARLVDGEPPVHCQVVLRVSGAVTDALDELYFPLQPGWWACFGEGDDVQGAVLLDGNELTVSASSEARIDRMLGDLAVVLPAFAIITDERRPTWPRP